jgi:hypothetical protein
MADSKLRHVILLVPQTDEVIVYPRLVLPCIVEVEVFRLDIVFGQFLHLKLRHLFEKAVLLLQCHAPYDNGPVAEQKYLRRVNFGVKVQRVRRSRVWFSAPFELRRTVRDV